MKTFAFIFARGGSKGVLRKNIRHLDGKPLLAYSVIAAQNVDEISSIFVSTEDKEIAAIGLEYGAEIIDRPKELAQDHTPEWLAWKHAIDWIEGSGECFDRFISLPTTSPLRNTNDIISCLNLLDKTTDMVVTMTHTSRSPYFNMVVEKNGYVNLMLDTKKGYSRRQDVPTAYNLTTVAYVARPEFIKKSNKIFDGSIRAVLVPKERAIDIDDEIDFQIAEMLIRDKY